METLNAVIKRRTWSSREMIADRAVGALLGQAVGDALGFRYQYRSGEDVRNQIAMDKDNSGFLPIRGSAVFDFPPGQVSDGSELCMLVARSLCRTGSMSVGDVITQLLKWADSDPLNMDETMLGVLNLGVHTTSSQLLTHEQLEQRVLSNAFTNNVCNLSNKCLFIGVPLGLASVHSESIGSASARVARIIQPNAIAIDALRVLATTIRSLIVRADVQKAVDIAYNTSRSYVVREHIALSALRPHPQLEPDDDDSSLREELRIDYLGIALQCAFYQLQHAKTFCEGVIAALQIGGDTTANAAITAALLGARFGSNAIPKQWRDTVTMAVLDRHEAFPEVCFSDVNVLVDQLLNKVSLGSIS
uniref:ADP-ribosylhydrolase ARH3 n=1 Tax=Parascaris univalens TaxID=6257 RepID=A0A915AVH6_PARUN